MCEMGKKCNTQERREQNFRLANLKGINNLELLRIHGIIILNWMLRHWFPNCIPRIARDALSVLRGSMDTFL